jgi:glycosyltransferase involved in cell wall biosynthesis
MAGAGGSGPVILDLQSIQSPDHRGRGIARYSHELAVALVAAHPDLVGRILLNPDLAPPGDIEPLLATGKVAYSGTVDAIPAEARIFHTLSPFELELPLRTVWPREASRRGLLLALSVYDLIPEVLAHHYLRHPGPRARYRSRLRLLDAADHLLAISGAAKGQVIDHLGIDESRISVVGTGTSPGFRPAESRPAALAAAARELPELHDQFVLYPAGTDFRKNIEGLIRAYAQIPDGMRDSWQLVVACEMTGQPHAHYSHVCRTLGIADRVLLTGFVSDECLLALYQSAGLVVFPSLAEGYGLPVAEAIACGAAAIGSDIPAIAELIPEDQRFVAGDEGALVQALTRALADDGWRATLASRAGRPVTTWGEVADRVASVYEQLLRRGMHGWRSRRSIAFVSPFPPAPTGVSHHSLRLTEELVADGRAGLDVFVDGLDRSAYEAVVPDGAGAFPVAAVAPIEALRGGYDEIVYALGNSDYHLGALAELRRRSGTVLAHDVRLTNLYWFGDDHPQAVPRGFEGSLIQLYGSSLPEQLVRAGRPSHSDEEQYGLLMMREVVDLASRVLVSSRAAAALAELDAGSAACAGKLEVLPFAAEPPVAARSGFENRTETGDALPPGDYPLVVALGILHPIRQPIRLLEAFAVVRAAVPECRLAFVGPAPEELAATVRARASELGIGDVVDVTGQVETETFLWLMKRATCAVQLREFWNGEASGTVGECLVAGVPLVVSDIGWMHELPDDAVVKIAPTLAPETLGRVISEVVQSDEQRRGLVAGALAFAPQLSFAAAAAHLVDRLFPDLATSGGAEPV